MAGIVTNFFDKFADRQTRDDPYLYWEPWDCDLPSPEVFKKAEEDGVDLVSDECIELAGQYPRPFQTDHVLSTKKISIIQAGSQSGKTIANMVILCCMVSRTPPYSLRYDKGVDTGIRRAVSEWNIRRFGRRDVKSGRILDHDHKAKADGTWDCGNIIGAGKFPEELYAPSGSAIWIGTLAKAVLDTWWPALAGTSSQRFFPMEIIDTSRGNGGYNIGNKVVHCVNDIDIAIKSYELGHTKFESKRAWALFYDEEPPEKQIYISGSQHAVYQRFSFTPLRGITWSKELFFACIDKDSTVRKNGLLRKDFDYFYASQYDSPYQDKQVVEQNRRGLQPWDRRSRVWGQYSEFDGQPFFDRSKLQEWRRKYLHPYKTVEFQAERSYHGIRGSPMMGLPGIMGVRVQPVETDADSMRGAWRMYETVRKGVGYLATFDAAEGAINPEEVQDKSFGLITRAPLPEEVESFGRPVVVAACRSSLPTIRFAESGLPVLRYYNNALLAAERGHGKDNEAFGRTLDEWPYWYYYMAQSGATGRLRPKKGFDTTTKSRTMMMDFLREWIESVDREDDPGIRDELIYGELSAAIIKETAAKKLKRCDHPTTGSLDGVICLGIATYILHETPNLVVCNVASGEEKKKSRFMDRFSPGDPGQRGYVPFGSGIGNIGGR